MTIVAFAVSIILGIAAANPAPAAESDRAPAVPAVALTVAQQAAPTPPVRVRRYCITDRREGAPRRPKVCRTREDWQARGFDPLVAIGQQ